MFQDRTILVIDDNEMERELIREILSDEYNIVDAENGQEALDILMSLSVEVSAIIVDLIMPRIDGFKFINMVQKSERFANLPIIVITASNDINNEVKALECGAWDFITKPFHVDIIKCRLKNAIDRSQITLYKQFKHKFEFDELTELCRRNKFYEVAEKLVKHDRERQYAFCRVDIDRFKMYNSYFGLREGDNLLRFLAHQIRLLLLDYDKGECGRIEDDVFCFVVPYDKDKILKSVSELKQALAEYNPSYDIVPSIGIYPIEDVSAPISSMYDSATLAAKQNKGSYANYCSIYNSKLRSDLVAEQEIVNEMNSALTDNQFIVYLQPKFNLQTQRLIGSEALVRWTHPTKGMIMPGAFIPVFEQNGFIAKLDYYMWEKTCAILKKWHDEKRRALPISVNVSRVNMYNPHLCEILLELINKYQISPSELRLELTESAYTDDPEMIQDMINKLRKEGFEILMDDFGSGYSSLNMLKDMYIDELKIDMKFLSRNNELRGSIILQSIIDMAKALKLPVIAEGVETNEQVEFLREIGCDFAQGYYFSKPIPLSEYEAMLEKDGNE